MLTHVYNNISYKNARGFYFAWNNNANVFRNNVSYNNPHADKFLTNAVHDHNSWDSAVKVTDEDFISLDLAALSSPRKLDGSLPDIDFLKLKPGSDLIDAGVDVGLPFKGTAPDMGPGESAR